METDPRPAELGAPAEPSTPPPWSGWFDPFVVGDPGKAPDRVISKPDHRVWHRAETVLDAMTFGADDGTPVLTLRAASLRGLSHRHYGVTRQDDYAFRITPDGVHLVVGVADGVSAGKWSHLAARWAARSGVEDLCRVLSTTAPDDIDWPDFVTQVAGRIERGGRQRLLHLGVAAEDLDSTRQVARHLATTVLYAVVGLVGPGTGDVHICVVGDTSAWVLADGSWHPLQAIKNAGAEVYSSSVTALPLLPRVPPPVIRARVEPGQVLALMTDGVGDPLDDGAGSVGQFLADRWRMPPSGLEFAAQVDFRRSSYDDDRTVVALWPL
jgi:hypothetical protein